MYMPTASGGPGVAQRELAAVTVGIIPDRPGQILRQALQERFERTEKSVPHRYDLSVAYEIEGEGVAVLHDNTTTRVRLTGRAQWTLRAQDPQRTVLATGTARTLDAVNLLREQYFSLDLGNEAAQVRIANGVADQITGQLASFFNRRAAGTA